MAGSALVDGAWLTSISKVCRCPAGTDPCVYSFLHTPLPHRNQSRASSQHPTYLFPLLGCFGELGVGVLEKVCEGAGCVYGNRQ